MRDLVRLIILVAVTVGLVMGCKFYFAGDVDTAIFVLLLANLGLTVEGLGAS